MKVLLVGVPGAGKTTISKLLNGVDTDDVIAKDYNKSLAKYIENNCTSVEDFILKEGEVVRDVLRTSDSKLISSGGSIVHDPKTIEYIKENNVCVIWLHIEDLSRGSNENERGVVYPKGINNRRELINYRIPLYASIARYFIRTDIENIEQTIERVKNIIDELDK